MFAQTTGYLSVTTGPFALSAWAGHGLTGGMGIVAFIAPPACLIRIAVRRAPVAAGDDRAAGRVRPTDGLAVAPTIAYCGSRDPRALWGEATALFIAGSGATGYATRRGLTAIARASFWGRANGRVAMTARVRPGWFTGAIAWPRGGPWMGAQHEPAFLHAGGSL